MKKVLVTGATGFIGNYVVEELLKRNFNVIASSSSREKAAGFPWYKQVTFVELNLQNIDEGINYFNFFKQPQSFIHLAWEGLPDYTGDFHITKNLPRHLALLKNMVQNGLSDITVAGTCFEYGLQEGQLSENIHPKPVIEYATAKDEMRKNLQQICASKPVSLKWMRLFYMYGNGQHPNSLIPQLNKALAEKQEVFNMSAGEQQRDFLPVGKVAEYIVTIAAQKNVTGIINVCSGKPVMVKDFVKEYLQQNNKSIQLHLGYYPYNLYEPMRFWGDDTKLQSIIENESFL